MPASFAYGGRHGHLVHARELDDMKCGRSLKPQLGTHKEGPEAQSYRFLAATEVQDAVTLPSTPAAAYERISKVVLQRAN